MLYFSFFPVTKLLKTTELDDFYVFSMLMEKFPKPHISQTLRSIKLIFGTHIRVNPVNFSTKFQCPTWKNNQLEDRIQLGRLNEFPVFPQFPSVTDRASSLFSPQEERSVNFRYLKWHFDFGLSHILCPISFDRFSGRRERFYHSMLVALFVFKLA